jgi:hypothetical protein
MNKGYSGNSTNLININRKKRKRSEYFKSKLWERREKGERRRRKEKREFRREIERSWRNK